MLTNANAASKPKLWRSCRLTVSFCIFLASAQTSLLRDGFGIALICMSKPQYNITCTSNDAAVPTLPWLINKQNCEFIWDSATRGRILAAFLYGYISTTMLGGYMSKHFGVKIPFMCSGIGNTFFHLLCPFAVLAHTELFFASRFLQGMFAGLMAGPFFELFGSWVPESETPALLSFGFSGFMFGTILAYPLSGQLCDVNVNGFGGWPLIFYVPGIISIFIVVYWIKYLYGSPEDHPNISYEEYRYLLENIGVFDESYALPWPAIFTSLPFIAYVIYYSTFMWNILTIMNNMPIFMQNVIGVGPRENGYLFCIPTTITFVVRIFNGKLYPMIKNCSGLSHTSCRKLCCTVGSSVLIISLLTLIFVQDMSKWQAISAISVNLAFGEFAYSAGFFPTLLNMAPNFAGLLSGVSTFIAFLIGSSSILVNSTITKQNTKEEWDMVFWIIVFMFLFSMCFYLIFGSASLQKWSIATQDNANGHRSRSTILLTRSFGASRHVSVKHASHIY